MFRADLRSLRKILNRFTNNIMKQMTTIYKIGAYSFCEINLRYNANQFINKFIKCISLLNLNYWRTKQKKNKK